MPIVDLVANYEGTPIQKCSCSGEVLLLRLRQDKQRLVCAIFECTICGVQKVYSLLPSCGSCNYSCKGQVIIRLCPRRFKGEKYCLCCKKRTIDCTTHQF